MNKPAIRAVAVKDMRAITVNFQVWGPMVILPVLFTVVLPLVLMLALSHATLDPSLSAKFLPLLAKVASPGLRATLESLPGVRQQLAFLVCNFLFAPFFLLIPLMAATTTSAQSFAGEKESGTLESLLFAPVDLPSLFIGKTLAGLLPAVGLSVVCFVLYGVTVNAAGWPLFGGLFFPQLNWLPLMLLVVPAISLCAVLFTVYVSARVSSFQAAYQLSGLVILPVLLLLGGQAGGLMVLDAWVLTVIGAVLIALDLVLLRLLAGRLSRGQLFESQVR